ncbi:MAG TPA: hypothetical protein PLL06_08525 [Acidobacteriota bacterium]|nr:hypothetical protein [Acidobacteriota bacterium]HMZ79732.1 hypothetical protein [Acidobacteriota bacterium]HND20068.1 hypothetical protein [Acidobacteriota bacterium]
MSKPIIAVGTDLLFSSKIHEASTQTGIKVEFARRPEDVLAKVRAFHPAWLLIDLNSQRVNALDVISGVRAEAELDSIQILGFISHIQKELRQAALQAGCSKVIPRSEFSARLPELLLELSV